MNIIKKIVNNLCLILDREAAEVANEIRLIEAAAHDTFVKQLIELENDEEERQIIRAIAITVAKAGVSSGGEAASMIAYWHAAKSYNISLSDLRKLAQSRESA